MPKIGEIERLVPSDWDGGSIMIEYIAYGQLSLL
jgi:hypothetical protein